MMMKLVRKTFLVFLLSIPGYFASAQSPCGFLYGSNETDSLKCLEEISLFRMLYDQKNYADAYKSWQYIVTKCPCSWNGVFTYSQTMFDNLIKQEKDSARRELLIDSLLWSYDVRHVYHPTKYTEGNGLGFKAFNTMRYRNKDYKNAFEWFITSIEMEKENTQPHIWDVYFKTAEGMVKMTKDTTLIIDAYERANEYIEVAIVEAYKKYDETLLLFDNLNEALEKGQIDQLEYNKRRDRLSSDTTNQMKLVEMSKKTLSNIEGVFMPYAPCNVLEQVYGKKLQNSKDNLNAVKKIVITMNKSGCINSSVFAEALEILHRAEPGGTSAYLMGNFSIKREDIDKAIEYFNEALRLFETNEQKVDVYYMLGNAYMIKGNYSEARSMALNALKIKPNMGKAYILIGKLYAYSGSRCSTADYIPLSVSWAAADKYNRAKTVDPSCAEEANRELGKLQFPSREEKFKRGLNAGDPVHIGCWIQENTTVR